MKGPSENFKISEEIDCHTCLRDPAPQGKHIVQRISRDGPAVARQKVALSRRFCYTRAKVTLA